MFTNRQLNHVDGLRRGFTLVEVMIVMGIGVTMLGMASLSTVELYKAFSGAVDYRNIHENARQSLAYLSRDIRAASNLVSFATSDITLNVVNSTGGLSSVRYQLVNNNLQRTATTGSVVLTNLLTDNVTLIAFEPWTNPGSPSSTVADTFEIRVSLTVTNTAPFRSVAATDLLQVRALMRNKQ